MPNILLTGAGFSRNWGGWLGDEAFEYLLGTPDIGPTLKNALWTSWNKGLGFEDTLTTLQADESPEGQRASRALRVAISHMFDAMNSSLVSAELEFSQDGSSSIVSFLERFDAIFTLNQDLFLEAHYLRCVLPGMKRVDSRDGRPSAPHTADPDNMVIEPRRQPYFKLHGSSNLFERADATDLALFVMGGAKPSEVGRYPLLDWYAEQFQDYLTRPDTKLTIVGYGFGDAQINGVIEGAARNGNLRIFIIDPAGIEVINKCSRQTGEHPPTPFALTLQPCVVSASRRGLSDIFGNQHAERGKVMRFIE